MNFYSVVIHKYWHSFLEMPQTFFTQDTSKLIYLGTEGVYTWTKAHVVKAREQVILTTGLIFRFVWLGDWHSDKWRSQIVHRVNTNKPPKVYASSTKVWEVAFSTSIKHHMGIGQALKKDTRRFRLAPRLLIFFHFFPSIFVSPSSPTTSCYNRIPYGPPALRLNGVFTGIVGTHPLLLAIFIVHCL
jgi:hypothetical protein